jgi:hypothetical protein
MQLLGAKNTVKLLLVLCFKKETGKNDKLYRFDER